MRFYDSKIFDLCKPNNGTQIFADLQDKILALVPTLCLGTDALRYKYVTQSVTISIPTQSVGTRDALNPENLRSSASQNGN